MKSALLRKQLEPVVGSLVLRERAAPEGIAAGIPGVAALRGCLTEIVGRASSGRTTLLLSLMAAATAQEEVCALVDAGDVFHPASAAAAGVDLGRLLWVRCAGDAERALKSADLLVQGGGFGLVVMDLGDIAPQTARRISLTSWFRLRRAVENTPSALVVVEREPHAKSCASQVLELRRRGVRVQVDRRKPVRPAGVSFEVCLPAFMP